MTSPPAVSSLCRVIPKCISFRCSSGWTTAQSASVISVKVVGSPGTELEFAL